MEIDKLFGGIYKEKRVLVTGHTGFKGSWLIYWLQKMGADVSGLALEPPTNPNHLSLLSFPYTSYIQNINEKNQVREILKEVNPEIIFHLAAQPLVRLSYEDPYNTYLTNIMGTVNILEASRNLPDLKAVLIVTSDKCYENKEWIWGYRENDPMGGKDPYSSSKGCAELVTAAWRHSYFNPENYGKDHQVLIASARAGNVIGGGDWAADRIVPDIVKATNEANEVVLRYPGATRPWQHVLEPLSGYLALGCKLLEGRKEFAEGWNFGPNHENNVTVLELVKEAQKNWGKIKYSNNANQQLHEAGFLMLDSGKAIKLLKWEPVWSFAKTVEHTINWYKEFYEKGSVKTDSTLIDYIKDAQSRFVLWSLQ